MLTSGVAFVRTRCGEGSKILDSPPFFFTDTILGGVDDGDAKHLASCKHDNTMTTIDKIFIIVAVHGVYPCMFSNVESSVTRIGYLMADNER